MFDPTIDHLVYAVPDLEVEVEAFAARTGVQPRQGGSHPGRGTRNALVTLGPGYYLEIIGPDPSQPDPASGRRFGIDRLVGPRLVTWAVKAPNMDDRVARARAAGYDPGEPQAMGRDRPDGARLEWRLSVQATPLGDGLVPFLIDWGATPHPSADPRHGCTLVSLRGEHPRPEVIRPLLQAIGAELALSVGPSPALFATLDTARGRTELR